MRNIFAVIGMFGTVILIAACGVVALWVGNILLDVNRAPVALETAVSTLEAAGSVDSTVRLVDVQDAPGTSGGGVVEAVVVETAVPVPTQPAPTPTATATPSPTRPAIESLPQGEGPYTVEQMQICRDVWVQSLQGELNTHQFGYCKGVVER